jgi:hypothetical protein
MAVLRSADQQEATQSATLQIQSDVSRECVEKAPHAALRAFRERVAMNAFSKTAKPGHADCPWSTSLEMIFYLEPSLPEHARRITQVCISLSPHTVASPSLRDKYEHFASLFQNRLQATLNLSDGMMFDRLTKHADDSFAVFHCALR